MKKLSKQCSSCNKWRWCGREGCVGLKDEFRHLTAEEANTMNLALERSTKPSTYNYRDKEKRKEYMKEYMRKRRK